MPWTQISKVSAIFVALWLPLAAMANIITIYEPKYAQGFRVIQDNGKNYIQVRDLRSSESPPERFSTNQSFRGLALTSTTQYPLVELLGLADHVMAAASKKYFQKISGQKSIKDLGQIPQVESLKAMPGVLLISHVDSSEELEQIKKIQDFKIPVFKMRDHLEPHFMGRIEWIMALGHLLDKVEVAHKIFTEIEQRYFKLGHKQKPLDLIVLAASAQGDQWMLKNQDGAFGRIFMDAGVALPSIGQVVHKEKFHEYALKADVCLIEGMPTTMKQLQKQNPLIEQWKCVKDKKIFNYDKLISKNGGNDFWETAVMRPDLLLQEYMILFHKELYQPNQLRWYKLIK